MQFKQMIFRQNGASFVKYRNNFRESRLKSNEKYKEGVFMER